MTSPREEELEAEVRRLTKALRIALQTLKDTAELHRAMARGPIHFSGENFFAAKPSQKKRNAKK